jgi:hypothetical protein
MLAATIMVVAGGVVALVVNGGNDTATDIAAVRPDPTPVRLGPQGAHPQFIVECDWSHSALDDPIVMPGGQCPDAQPVPMVQLILAVLIRGSDFAA